VQHASAAGSRAWPGLLVGSAALVAATPVWSTAAYSISLAALLISWLAAQPWRAPGWRPPLPFAPAAFAAALLLATIAAADRGAAWEEFYSYYPFLLVILAADVVRGERDLLRIAACFLISCGIAAAAATLQGLGLLDWQESRFRGTVGIFEYAACMVLAWSLTIWMFLRVRGRLAAAGFFLLSFLFLDAIRLNATRASLVALTAAFAVMAIFGLAQWRRLLLLLLPFAVAVPLAMQSEIGARLLKSEGEISLDDPQSQRQTIWAYAWTLFRDAPWLGAGPGDFTDACASLRDDPRLADYPRLKHPYKTAHSVPLHLLATSGAVGLAGFLMWAGWTVAHFLRAAYRAPRHAVPALAAFAAVLAFGATDMSLLNTRISGLLCLTLGLGISALRLDPSASGTTRVTPGPVAQRPPVRGLPERSAPASAPAR